MRQTFFRSALVVFAFAIATCIPTGAGAQGKPGPERHKWWQSEQVKMEVGLSGQQSTDLEAVFQSYLPRLRAGWEELDRFEQEVSRLMTDDTADEARVSAAVDRAETARASLNKTRTLMLFKMYRVLSPEQRVKLKSFHDRRSRERQSGPSSSR